MSKPTRIIRRFLALFIFICPYQAFCADDPASGEAIERRCHRLLEGLGYPLDTIQQGRLEETGTFVLNAPFSGSRSWGDTRAVFVSEFVRLGVTVVEAQGLDDYAALQLFRGGQLIGEVVFLPVEIHEEPEPEPAPPPLPEAPESPPKTPPETPPAPAEPVPEPAPEPLPPPPPVEPIPLPSAPAPETPEDPAACEAITQMVHHVLLSGGIPEDRFPPEGQTPETAPPKMTVLLPSSPSPAEVAEWVESAMAEYGFYVETYQGGPHRAIIRVSQEHRSCLELVCVTEDPEPWALAEASEESTPPPPPPALPTPPPPPQEAAPPLVPAPAKEPPPARVEGPVRVAIILDDGGWGGPETRRVLALDNRVTLAILPNAPKTEALAREAAAKGFEVMLHMPMESSRTARIFPGQIETTMDRDTIHRLARAAIAQIPGLAGVNNHTGTLFTQDAERMGWFMEALREKNLYFVDSMTTARSTGHTVAAAAGLKTARRNVFLDNDSSLPYIRSQLRELVRHARARGSAVAIGHFRRNTVTVLEEALPGLEKEGVVLTRMSELVQ